MGRTDGIFVPFHENSKKVLQSEGIYTIMELQKTNGKERAMALLTLKDIGKIYVSDGNVSVGIRGVNLTFDRGEFVAVTGKSGSGKSTLLNVIGGMDTYEEGELFIE